MEELDVEELHAEAMEMATAAVPAASDRCEGERDSSCQVDDGLPLLAPNDDGDGDGGDDSDGGAVFFF